MGKGKCSCPDFLQDATNVYRTANYIVKQHIGYKPDLYENDVLFSHDTYYARTPKREREYEEVFADRIRINGKRIRTAMYSRTYVEE